ncbi:hypothetical protein IU421_14840 [Nocardia cyriacigeorgica]|uniref:hypothetical protein n=1 Tax=Nocardia cyriacigeorgica TaxID=135487 RepID=UPI001893AE1C|nr:hypothetical protein [Nocardia cyriacigeorgica]MBF6515547.1 hypothetical protein [Nocardia cyriacigeorgica]
MNHPDGTIVVNGPNPAELHELCRLTDMQPTIKTHTTGTARYKAGAVYTRDLTAAKKVFDAVLDAQLWIVFDGTYIRVTTISMGWNEGRIEASQGADIGYALISGTLRDLRLVEPSPPRPSDEWVDAERARAIRDLLGEARPEVLIPDSTHGWRRFDSWNEGNPAA